MAADPKGSLSTVALAEVLELILPQQVAWGAPEASKPYVVASYLNDFQRLWNISDDAKESIVPWILSKVEPPIRTVILVWDGIPPPDSTIDIRNYVTPF